MEISNYLATICQAVTLKFGKLVFGVCVGLNPPRDMVRVGGWGKMGIIGWGAVVGDSRCWREKKRPSPGPQN